MNPEHLVCFAHGKESGPWGTKITHLAEVARRRGFEVASPDYRHTHEPQARLAQLLAAPPQARRALVLVGSSMGGWVSAMACEALKPNALFLIAPALYFPGWDAEPPRPPQLTRVVHGWGDDIVPVERAIRYAQQHTAALHLLGGGHTLNERLPELARLFDELLQSAVLDADYRATNYFVCASADDEIALTIDRHDAAADARLTACGIRASWAIVTASNPRSQMLAAADNRARGEALKLALGEAALRSLPSQARDPDGRWPSEDGELLCDPPPGFAEALAQRFDQNAIVRGRLGQAPELFWV